MTEALEKTGRTLVLAQSNALSYLNYSYQDSPGTQKNGFVFGIASVHPVMYRMPP